MFRSLYLITIRINAHTPKFITPKRLVVFTTPQLLKDDGTGTLEFNNQTNDRIQPAQDKNDNQQAEKYVKKPFGKAIILIFQRLIPQ
jgi:hypothetical protein